MRKPHIIIGEWHYTVHWFGLRGIAQGVTSWKFGESLIWVDLIVAVIVGERIKFD